MVEWIGGEPPQKSSNVVYTVIVLFIYGMKVNIGMHVYTHINTDTVTATLFKPTVRASDISGLFLYAAKIDGSSHLQPECTSQIYLE